MLPSDIDVVRAALPSSFSVFHVPRAADRGGGVAVIYSSALKMKPGSEFMQFSSFEFMETKFTCHSETVNVYVIYCPGHPGTDRPFMEEFGSFLEGLLSVNGKILIGGFQLLGG